MNILDRICAELADSAARAPKSEEYKQLLHEFDCNINKFDPTLTIQQRSLILELENQRNLLAAIDEETMFTQGFCMGANLMLALLTSPCEGEVAPHA